MIYKSIIFTSTSGRLRYHRQPSCAIITFYYNAQSHGSYLRFILALIKIFKLIKRELLVMTDKLRVINSKAQKIDRKVKILIGSIKLIVIPTNDFKKFLIFFLLEPFNCYLFLNPFFIHPPLSVCHFYFCKLPAY